ncbi:MAG TPA: 3'-5' exonuclease [Dokdonella sp.]|nr:3'-5' exonuclease [Dokdonella sp.]
MSNAYLLDTETTDKREGEIIEACTILLLNADDLFGDGDDIRLPLMLTGANLERFKPGKPITTGAMAVHHILPHELEGCRPSSEFAVPADCKYVIGHSVDFDWEAAGRPDVKRIDTHAMAQWVYPDAGGYSLSALIYLICGATVETRALLKDAHSAYHDCRLAAILLADILRLRPEITTWSALWQFSEECRIPRTCPMKKYEGVPLTDLDDGFIDWCLRQDFIDPYYRKGLERVMADRYGRADDFEDDEAPGDSERDDEEESEDVPF